MNVRDPRRTPSQAFGRTSWDVVVVDWKRFVVSGRKRVSLLAMPACGVAATCDSQRMIPNTTRTW
jgi:hypothetical protein